MNLVQPCGGGLRTRSDALHGRAGETIHILPLSWVEDSIDQGQKLAEKDYDYEANAEQEEDGAEEDAAPEDEEDAKPAKGKGKEKTSSSKSNDQGKKRARSPTPTPPPAPAPAPKMVKVQQKGTCPVDHLFPYKGSFSVSLAPAPPTESLELTLARQFEQTRLTSSSPRTEYPTTPC